MRPMLQVCALVCESAHSNLVVVDSRDLLEGLLPDHDRGQVGSVAGQHQ